MNIGRDDAGTTKPWRLVAGAMLIALCFWAISWNRVATWIESDAARRESQWTQGTGPWQWSLDRSEDIVWPGSHGLADLDSPKSAASGAVPNGIAEFSLALRGGRIDLSLVDSIMLEGEFDARARVIVLADSERGSLVLAEHSIDIGNAAVGFPLSLPRAELVRGMRLRVETTPASGIALRRLALLPPQGIAISTCTASASVQDTLDACDARIARIAAPASLLPEAALRWRDGILAQRPGAVVRTPTVIPTWDRLPDRVRAMPAPGIALAIVLIALPLLGASISRLLPPPSRRRAAIELAMVFVPWLVMLWIGWPGDDASSTVSMVLLACVASALLLQGIGVEPQAWGNVHAWRASALLMLAASPLLVATATANALDQDGFIARSLSPEKFWQYPLWVVLQQWLLIRAIAPRLRYAIGSEAFGAFAAGALFGLLHLPNLSLMLATFVAGTAWAWLGFRHRALLPLVTSHVVLGLAWLWLAPPWLLRSAEIGGRFLMAP